MWGFMASPGFTVFAMLSVVGTMLVLFSGGLLGMWICLEVGFFGFIPILNGVSVQENESAVKYFIIQGVGSGLLLMSFLVVGSDYLMASPGVFRFLGEGLMLLGFMTKLGVFPMHFWFPSVMGGASWFSCFWLSVVQKLGPFWAVGGIGLSGSMLSVMMLLMVLTSVVGSFGGLAQVQFRPLLAYSSLGQTGWMGMVVLLSVKLFVFYIFLYSVLLFGLLLGLNSVSSYSVGGIPGWGVSKGLFFWLYGCSFFISLSGVPPLAGCVLKLMGVLISVNFYPFYLAILIMTSMVSLYYYLSMFISGVVCVGGSSFSAMDGVGLARGLGLVFICIGVLNWLGGFPLFMFVGGMMI